MGRAAALATLGGLLLLSGCKTAADGRGAVKAPKTVKGYDKLPPLKQREFDQVFFEAQKEKITGNYQRAIGRFADALRVDPNSAVANYEIGRLLQMSNQFSQAVQYSARAAELEPANKWYLIQLSDLYKQLNQWSEALATLERLEKLEPNNALYLMERARIQEYLKQYNDAIKTYERVEKKFGHSEEVSLNKYRLYINAGKSDKALAEAERLYSQNTADSRYALLLADAYQKAGKQAKAIEILETLEDNGDAQLALAESLYNQKKYDQSFAYLKKAFANPSLDINNKIGILYGNYLRQQRLSPEQNAEAYELARILVDTHETDAKSHAIYADFLYQDKKYDEALKQYRRSRDLQSNIFPVWTQIFNILAEKRDAAGLEKETSRGMELFPTQPIAFFYNGRARMDLKQYGQALNSLQGGLALVADNKPLEAELYSSLGECYYRLGDYERMEKNYDASLQIEPSNATALNNYAYYLSVANRDMEKAAKMSAKSLELEPNNASFLDTYGYIQMKRGKLADAEKYIKKSLDKNPDNGEVLDHYGDVMYRLGKVDEAVKYWEKAKEHGADTGEKIRKRAE